MQNAAFPIVEAGGTYICHWALKGVKEEEVAKDWRQLQMRSFIISTLHRM
jgi:hypothetical protein